jgi:hypothetical protein
MMNTSRSTGSPRPMPISPTWGKTQQRVPTFPPRPPPPTHGKSPSHPSHPTGCPTRGGATFGDFKGCIECPTRTISVPRIKYILNQKPVVYESIDSETKYDQVPVNYEFEKRVFPVSVTKPCPPCDAPCAAPCGPAPCADAPCGLPYGPRGFRGGPLGRPFSPRGAVLDNALADVTSWPTGPCSPKLPCAMKTHSNYNRYPCSPDVYRHGVGYGGRFGGRLAGRYGDGYGDGYPWGAGSRPFGFPRWKSQYVSYRKSPCATQTTSLCGLRSKCSSC